MNEVDIVKSFLLGGYVLLILLSMKKIKLKIEIKKHYII